MILSLIRVSQIEWDFKENLEIRGLDPLGDRIGRAPGSPLNKDPLPRSRHCSRLCTGAWSLKATTCVPWRTWSDLAYWLTS